MYLYGVTGIATTQHAVCGGSKIMRAAGTKNGASGTTTGVGNTTAVFNQIVFYSLAPVPIVVA